MKLQYSLHVCTIHTCVYTVHVCRCGQVGASELPHIISGSWLSTPMSVTVQGSQEGACEISVRGVCVCGVYCV